MAETSGPWAGVNWNQADWEEAFSKVVSDGVFQQSTVGTLLVFGDSTGMQVKVPAGEAWVFGHKYKNSAQVTKAIAAADASNPRIDLVVLRADFTDKTVTIQVKTGTPASSPTAPALTQNSSLWEIPLAEVRVNAAVSTITSGNVTDKRNLLGATGRNVQMGTVTLTWPGGSKNSNLATVTFSPAFPTTPFIALGPYIYGVDNLTHIAVLLNKSTTGFQIYGQMNDYSTVGAGPQRQVDWIAMLP